MLEKPASDFEIEMHTRIKDNVKFPSRYEFLKGHNGIRPKCLHGLISPTGIGKSSLLKCVIAEAAAVHPVLVWHTEEEKVEYQELINKIDKSVLDNIVFVDEKKIPKEYKDNLEKFHEYFNQMVDESGCELIFIDNITTSVFYSQRFGFYGQNQTAEFLYDFAKTKCEIFYIAHTEKSIKENYGQVVVPEDIRGSKELSLRTEYFYCIQRFTSNEKIYNLLRVAKYRHHRKARGWFALKFEHESYVGDSRVPFELVNKIFQGRDYLGRRLKKKPKDAPKDPQMKLGIDDSNK